MPSDKNPLMLDKGMVARLCYIKKVFLSLKDREEELERHSDSLHFPVVSVVGCCQMNHPEYSG
jgi:hypothetical protein